MGYDMIAIGASRGGIPILRRIAGGLPGNLNAAVFVVSHIGLGSRGCRHDILDRAGSLPARYPYDGETIEPGRVRLGHAPREHRTRPAIDPLFRSAAISYGPSVVGVVLTGLLAGGTAGLLAIKDRGGLAVIQDPAEAEAPSMPQCAARRVAVDHCRLSGEMASLLAELAQDPPVLAPTVAAIIWAACFENPIATGEVAANGKPGLETFGMPSGLTCPDCSAVLYELSDQRVLRFRCRSGHGFSAKSLLAAQPESREGASWSALNTLNNEASLGRRLALTEGAATADWLRLPINWRSRPTRSVDGCVQRRI